MQFTHNGCHRGSIPLSLRQSSITLLPTDTIINTNTNTNTNTITITINTNTNTNTYSICSLFIKPLLTSFTIFGDSLHFLLDEL